MSNEEFYKRVGQMLSEARKQKRLSQAEIARRLGLVRTAVTNIEAGRQSLSLHLFLDLCQRLDLEPVKVLAKLVDRKDEIVFPEGTREDVQELILRTIEKKG